MLLLSLSISFPFYHLCSQSELSDHKESKEISYSPKYSIGVTLPIAQFPPKYLPRKPEIAVEVDVAEVELVLVGGSHIEKYGVK